MSIMTLDANANDVSFNECSEVVGDSPKVSRANITWESLSDNGNGKESDSDSGKDMSEEAITPEDKKKVSSKSKSGIASATKGIVKASEKAKASSNTSQAAAKTTRPASKTTKPASKTTKPASKTGHSTSKTAKPASKTEHSASKTTKPASKTGHSASKTTKPASKTGHSASKTAKPASKTNKTASKTAKPASKEREAVKVSKAEEMDSSLYQEISDRFESSKTIGKLARAVCRTLYTKETPLVEGIGNDYDHFMDIVLSNAEKRGITEELVDTMCPIFCKVELGYCAAHGCEVVKSSDDFVPAPEDEQPVAKTKKGDKSKKTRRTEKIEASMEYAEAVQTCLLAKDMEDISLADAMGLGLRVTTFDMANLTTSGNPSSKNTYLCEGDKSDCKIHIKLAVYDGQFFPLTKVGELQSIMESLP